MTIVDSGIRVATGTTWGTALAAAQREAGNGRHEEADRTLRDFAAEHERSAEAIEASYWRAVFMLDPASSTSSPREAAALLERYLAAGTHQAHRAEALILQRLAKALQAAPAAAPARVVDTSRDAEIKALKDELQETKAELDRIRKRLAPPTTPPPATPPPALPDAK
jgi:hypothetical protein